MALLSLKRNRSLDSAPSLGLRACRFERALMSDGLTEGGLLTCRCPDGREWSLTVAMTWDALGVLRDAMTRCDVYEPDETILRCVLRHWGVQEFSSRLMEGVELPSEDLVLRELGGPTSCQPRRLLQACGLLLPDAA